jgi:hypothetical protein
MEFMPKRSPRSKKASTVSADEQLRARTLEVQLQFAYNDLEVARTFVAMAQTEIDLGDIPHARELLRRAKQAAAVIARFLPKAPAQEYDGLTAKLAKLLSSIRDTEPSPEK